jgi:hypothetical protein
MTNSNQLYPTKSQIQYIIQYDINYNPVCELLDYIESLWHWTEYFKRTKHTLSLCTGGWSGNEDIIAALQDNFLFWTMYWDSTHSGGEYKFNDYHAPNKFKGFIQKEGQ